MSRRVWEILLLLHTNPEIKQGLQEIDSNSDLASLLDPESPQRLLYTFYIIDWLGRPARLMRHCVKVKSLPHRGRDPHWLTHPQAGWLSLLLLEVFAIFTMCSAAELLDGGAALPGASGGRTVLVLCSDFSSSLASTRTTRTPSPTSWRMPLPTLGGG